MQIVLTLTEDNKLSISQTGDLNFSQMTDVLATAQLSLMENMRSLAAKNGDNIDEDLFDLYNISASNVLDAFLPSHKRRDIQMEAIVRAEQEIMDAEVRKMS